MASKEGMIFKFFQKWKENRLNSFAKKMLKEVSKRSFPSLRKQSPSSCSSEVTQLLRNSQATSVDMKISENIIKQIILEEQPISLADILLRRTGQGWGADQGKSVTSEVATLMAEMKGWDEQRKEKEIQSFQQHIREMHQVQ